MYGHERALILSGGGARGAYEIGVWKYLCEMNWKPDLISGASVGAINGAAIAAGLSLDELVMLWKSIERSKIYRVSIFRRLLDFILKKGFMALMDTKPLRSLLESKLTIDAIRKSDIELVIAAVSVCTSEIAYFSNDAIDIDHVMASSAIPIFFPWQYINGRPYWDGGVMANAPIAPALEREVPEIIVVLLSPRAGEELPLPTNQKEAVERLFEHTQIASFESFRSNILHKHKGMAETRIGTVAPTKLLGFKSILDFSPRQSDELISTGYRDAKAQLADFFTPK